MAKVIVAPASSLPMDFPPAADPQHADDDAAILDIADDAPVADAVFPAVRIG
jgi:hypothetical protein